MANKNPVQPPAFKAQQAPKVDTVALGAGMTIRFTADVDAVLRDKAKVSDRQALVREAVREKLQSMGLLG